MIYDGLSGWQTASTIVESSTIACGNIDRLGHNGWSTEDLLNGARGIILQEMIQTPFLCTTKTP
jgi:hypothetical protein